MGNCCLPFAGHEDSEENLMESLALHSRGNQSDGISRHSTQTITSLPTYTSFPRYTPSRNIENQRKMAQYAFRGYYPGFGRIPKGSEAELVAAGWPSWLVEDAGEALKGRVPRKEKSFHKLEKVCSFHYLFFYILFILSSGYIST